MSSTPFERETLLLDTDENGISILTINRPEKLNALNGQVLSDLNDALHHIEESNDIRLLIITGSGEKAFVAGADIKELSTLDRQSGEETSSAGQNLFNRIETFPKPVIALVNGYALGGGAELAMACHIRTGTANAVFGLPEVSLGLIPGYGGTQRLPQLVGKGKAMEMILSGAQIKADEAKQLGLLNDIFDHSEAIEETKKLSGKILKNSPSAISSAISAVNAGYRTNGFAKEAVLFGQLCETDDFKEGTSAFLEKRKAKFTGN
ncbi:enoyl-CoA hydratase/isomerase family protein [Rhodohalobacter sp. 614A]|uniref:enoyl-CoA hydratase/isomerase family protein n=1 Tax=Rhodohalobacter sp. 614A TaxID=2908649 RepID=UPI001F181223|nr:enoyl-CoA hydratase-related protein [Rhodohalobacter sp. 614A]